MVLFGVMVGVTMPSVVFADQHTAVVTIQEGSAAADCYEPNECYFMPDTVTISAGGEVTWTNNDYTRHTITSYSYDQDSLGGTFDSLFLSPGDEFTHKFEEAGEYLYVCFIHPWLIGTVIVQETEVTTGGGVADQGEITDEPGGGCLVATAAYGTEMAPQIQRLREIRDQNILSTDAGSSFVTVFNGIYYTFSPTIADIEREHPLVKGAVFIIIQPILASLHIMEHADTEFTVIVYGMLVILLNVIMYVIVPVLATAWLLKAVAKRDTFRESLRHTAKAR